MINVKYLWSDDMEYISKSNVVSEYDYRIHAIQSALLIMFQQNSELRSLLYNGRIEYEGLFFGIHGHETDEMCKAFAKYLKIESAYSKQFYDYVFYILEQAFNVSILCDSNTYRLFIINIEDGNNDGVLNDSDINFNQIGDLHINTYNNINSVDDNIDNNISYGQYSSNIYKDAHSNYKYVNNIISNGLIQSDEISDYNISLLGSFNYNTRYIPTSPKQYDDGSIELPGGIIIHPNGSVSHPSVDDRIDYPDGSDVSNTYLDKDKNIFNNFNNNSNSDFVNNDNQQNNNNTINSGNNQSSSNTNKPSKDIIDHIISNSNNNTSIPSNDNNKYQSIKDNFITGLANEIYKVNLSSEIGDSWSSHSTLDIDLSSNMYEESSKHDPHFREDLASLSRMSNYDIVIVYGPNKQKYKKIKNVITRSVSQEVNASGEAIYDIIEFIAQDVVDKR